MSSSFEARLFRYPGKGGWTLRRYLTATRRRSPRVGGARVRFETSVWRDRTHGTLLPVPKKVRGKKGDGDVVVVFLELRPP